MRQKKQPKKPRSNATQAKRLPGQSSHERWEELLFDKVTIPVVIAAMLALFAALEWWYYLMPETRSPYPATLLAMVVLAYASFNFWSSYPKLNKLSHASESEQRVGQLLEGLREQGYRVFHDLQIDDIHLDHVVVGGAGVFTIETYALASREVGDLHFNGEQVLINGQPLPQNPVIQAKSQANHLKRSLKENVGKEFDVWPVVLFPGWNIEQPASAFREIWVLESKALPAFLAGKPKVLSDEQMKVVSGQISLFLRAQRSFGS